MKIVRIIINTPEISILAGKSGDLHPVGGGFLMYRTDVCSSRKANEIIKQIAEADP